jgi:hypothetical protein
VGSGFPDEPVVPATPHGPLLNFAGGGGSTRLVLALYRATSRLAVALLFRWDPANFTPIMLAFCRVAPSVRLSLRATTLVFVLSRAMVFSIRTSSLVQGFLFLTIRKAGH